MTVHEWLPPAVYGILSTTVAIQIFMSTKRQVYRQQNPVMSQKEKYYDLNRTQLASL